MARKSRKNLMPQAAAQEAVQQNEKELLRTAAYARLSVENGGHETEDSLHTQILQIHNYIRENPELTLTDTYADNGFTGTRFDRPEFERMMQDVRTGIIQCIVVKDLSRFGRDYIETGSYLETIFPMLHVRFIAINDDFDNIRQSDVDSLAVPIKNMVNSLYAKDISKKISLSYQMRREKGIPTSWCTPYGYQLNQQGNKFEATEDAKWVKLIYQWYLAGVSTNEIARRLEFLEVARPNERLNRKLHEGDDPTYNKWHPSTVLRIVNSSAYIGELVSGKTQTASYKGIGLHPVEKKEWHIVENAHEAIIDQETWKRTQERLNSHTRIGAGAPALSPLSGKVRCGVCGRSMKRNVYYNKAKTIQYYSLQCAAYKTGAMNCSNTKTISGKVLEEAVIEELNKIVRQYCQTDQIKLTNFHLEQIHTLKKQLEKLTAQQTAAQTRLTKMYKDKLDGLISGQEYTLFRDVLLEEEENASNQIMDLQQQLKLLAAKEIHAEAQHAWMETYMHFKKLDRTIAEEWIHYIEIGAVCETGEREILIHWNI